MAARAEMSCVSMVFFFSSRRRHTSCGRDWSSDVCSSDLNILGAEQSGHMAAVGFDLYSRLLAVAVEEQKAHYEHRMPVVERPSAVIDLPSDAHWSSTLVPAESQKLVW